MEQVMNRYQSPYRTRVRKIEVDKKTIKYWEKFVKQTIISGAILGSVIICENVSAISNSAVWNNATNFVKSDLKVEQIRNGIEWGVKCAKDKISYFLNKNNKEIKSEKEVEKNEEVKNIIPAKEKSENDITKNMTQAEKDIYNIRKSTTILRPVNAPISSKFGKRIDPVTKKDGFHTGTDFASVIGTQVKSAITGTVIEVKKSNVSLGNRVKVKNADIVTTYAHCSSIKVKEGDKVKQGDVIALSGNSGKSTGAHLHFEVIKDGRYVDPEKVI